MKNRIDKALGELARSCIDLMELIADKGLEKDKRISELEAKIKELEAEREWVSVDDRLPEIEDEYDVYGYRRDWVEHGFCNQRQASKRIPDMYFDGVLFDTDFIVTHWMPLPQSPKGGE